MQVLQRPDWHGSPIDLGELFILKKNGREATCKLRSHQFGWELVQFVGQQLKVVQTAALLYAFGTGVAWVRRGFKASAAP